MSNISYTLFVSFVFNVLLAVIKLATGYISSSSALIADALHTFSDLSTDLMGIINDNRIDKDKKYPYMYTKRERLLNIMIGGLIIILGLFIIYKATNRNILIPPIYISIICLLSLINKYLLYKYLKSKSIAYNEQVLKVNAKESYMDVISTLIVLISILLSNLSPYMGVFKYSDLIATIIVGLFIIVSGFNCIKDNIIGILGKEIKDEEYLKKLEYIINNISPDIVVLRVNVIKYSDVDMAHIDVLINNELTLNQASKMTSIIENTCKQYDKRIKNIIVNYKPYKKNT